MLFLSSTFIMWTFIKLRAFWRLSFKLVGRYKFRDKNNYIKANI